MRTRTIRIPEELALRLDDVAKANESTSEATAEEFIEAMLKAWEPHLVKDGQGGVMDIFEQEAELWREESASSGRTGAEEGEGWKQG